MLSKKMTVSLMSLITILALAFVAPSAMAATFDVALAEHADHPDIGAAPGLQVERPSDNKLKVKVMFGEFVILTAADISVGGFDMKGVYIPAVKRSGDLPTDASDEIDLTIDITAETSRVTVMIAKDIASANAFSKNMSKELTADIYLYSPDVDISPDVYGIRRADGSVLPLTGGAVNVVITLSEEPESLTAAHIDVTNATAGTPAKLDTVRQNAVGLTQFATHLKLPLLEERTVTEIRDGVANDDDVILAALVTDAPGRAVADGAIAGIDYYLSAHAAANVKEIPSKYIAAVIALKDAIGPDGDTEVRYYYEDKDGLLQPAAAMVEYEAILDSNNGGDGVNVSDKPDSSDANTPANNESGMPIVEKAIKPPTKQGTEDLDSGTITGTDTVTIPKETFDRSKKEKDYARPNAGDFATVADYNFARLRYKALTDSTGDTADLQRTAYKKEKKIYDAYIALQTLIQEARMEEITDREEELIAAAKAGTTTEIAGNVLPPTGRDGMLHPYSVTLTPTYATASDIVVKVNRWQNMASDPGVYKPPVLETGYTEGFDKLTIPVSASAVKTTPTVAQGPIVISLPFAVTIPAESPGFLIFAANAAGSGISIPGGVLSPDGLTTATAAARRPVERLYNIVDMSIASAAHATVEPLPNLQNFLRDGGTIYLAGPAGLVISEVMWGTDASLSPHSHSQWIEIKNVSGAPLTSPAGTLNLHFIGPHETLTAGTPVVDSVGTVAATGGVWNIFTRGLAGRTGTGEKAAGVTTVVAQQDVISMQRVFSDTAQRMPEAGNLQTSWAASTGPALNFDRDAIGRRIGSPGTEPLTPPPPTPAAPAATPAPSTPIAGADDIMITEIMVDTSSDRFPQWIEITHVGIGKASLNGWTMVVDNAIDGEVLGGGNAITLKLDGVELDVSTDTRNSGAGQSLLVVAWASGRKSGKIRSNGVLDVGPQLGQKGRYQLLSYEGFRITLVPPQTSAIATFGDRVGNLDEDWNILMLEGAKRSSMIRREMSTTGVPFDGTESAGWVLASATPLIAGPETYYGNDEDAGTPGYDAGGPLPVELSHFRPARDKQTGAVVITWATQSELNNAGFFIKRSNQRNGQFKVINPTLIPGAGTTSEKQMYTYTDATAQPNVVYYYQIEDVSLDGQRQTLTNGIRLKGHIGAAGKATTLWGELKSSNE